MVEVLNVAVPLLKTAPPFLAVLEEKVELFTTRNELAFVFKTAPPSLRLEFPVKFELLTVRLELVLMIPAPPPVPGSVVLLFDIVELEIEIEPPL